MLMKGRPGMKFSEDNNAIYKNKYVVGITGSIATGKSTAAAILRELGQKVIDADLVAHDLMKKGEKNYQGILGHFGEKILDDGGEISRKTLSDLVFSDKDQLNILNKLTHANIFNKIELMIEESSEKVIFIEIPLLVELLIKGEMPLKLDEIWLIYLSRQDQINRLINRNSLTEEEAIKRIDSQLPVEVKKEYCDTIINNNSDLNHLKKEIKERLGILYESII